MEQAKYQEAKPILQEALELPPGEREAFVARACGVDQELRSMVNVLLKAHAEAEGIFGAAPDRASGEETPGGWIGRFKLLQQIGEGGFGIVWMAEQEEPVRRKVALKVIRRGMDSRQVVARFEAERQALAMMEHPHIAKVLDGGETPSGRPYFVMELVKGLPITQFCDEHQLDVTSRLELFCNVCDAVQHAHQKAVIHRDIKPSNVLVAFQDSSPVPKVIDFGIAKATAIELTRKTLFTEHQQLLGTPEYMAPEQAARSVIDVDTRADVYSLGVLLYELLTGTRPFDLATVLEQGYAEMLRVIQVDDPPRPSSRIGSLRDDAIPIAERRRTQPERLGRLVRGDLDWIVMRALEKDRARRYETCNALAMDVKRHLQDEPVLASPPSATYRLQKLIKRNKGAFLAGALLFAVLALGAAGTALGLLRALAAEKRAELEAANAEFRLRFTRDEAGRAVEELGRVLWTARRTPDFSHFVPEHVRAQYPDRVLTDFDVRLGRLFPELGPTTVDAEDLGLRLRAPVAELLGTFAEAPDAERNAPLYEWARENHQRLQRLVDLIETGDPVVMLGWRPGSPLWQGYLPSLAARKQAVALLGSLAIVRHGNEEPMGTVEALRAGRGLARATGNSGYFITALSDARSRKTLYGLARWMILDQLRRGDCPTELIQFVIEDAPLPALEAEMRYEAMAARQVVGELFQLQERDGPPVPALEVWKEMAQYYYEPPTFSEVERAELGATLDAIETALDAYLELSKAHDLEMRTGEPPAIKALVRPEVASFLIPRMTNALKIVATAKRQRDATIIVAAIAEHRCRNGTWPADIDSALSGFPVQPLRRDYFGHDFVYHVEGDEPLLYAVGPDQYDDGGDDTGTPSRDELYLRPRHP